MATREIGRLADADQLVRSKGVGRPSEVDRADTASAIRYFMGAAQQQEFYTQTGLSYFRADLDQARSDIQANYQQAIAELRPQQAAARTALDEMMRFVGVDPTPATAGLQDAIQGITGVDTSELSNILTRAQTEKDSALRAQLREEALTGFQGMEEQIAQAAQQRIDQQVGQLKAPVEVKPTPPPDLHLGRDRYPGGWDKFYADREEFQQKEKLANEIYAQQLGTYNQRVAEITNQAEAQRDSDLALLGDSRSKFETGYKPEFDTAYTGSQVSERLRATPGYEFIEEAGTRAIERQSAARGMLGSANTLLALQQYGQDLASTYYGQHLQNLGNIASQGSAASGQIAGMFAQKGGLLSDLAAQQGAGTQQAYNLIGSAYADAFTRSGELEANVSQQYARATNQARESAKSRALSLAQSILSNEPAMRQMDQSAGMNSGLLAAAEEAEREDDSARWDFNQMLNQLADQKSGAIAAGGISQNLGGGSGQASPYTGAPPSPTGGNAGGGTVSV